jgi:transcriptional regulator
VYIPKYFRNEDPHLIKAFIAQNGFAILVSEVAGRPWATHIPLLLEQRKDGVDMLTGHISKANGQWKAFNNEKEVMAVFSGAHAYISSSWYDHENVPTWNYEAVHVYGKIRITAEDETKNHLAGLVDKYEAKMKCPVSVEKMTPEFYTREVKGLVGFEIQIAEIQAVSKLSQNRDAENIVWIVEGLKTQIG